MNSSSWGWWVTSLPGGGRAELGVTYLPGPGVPIPLWTLLSLILCTWSVKILVPF